MSLTKQSERLKVSHPSSATSPNVIAPRQITEALNLVATHTASCAPHRALFFGRSTMDVHPSGQLGAFSQNERAVTRFMYESNLALGFDMLEQSSPPPDIAPYSSMNNLAIGKALEVLSSVTDHPLKLQYNGRTLQAGSHVGNFELINRIASDFATQACGRIGIAAWQAAPNTFLRCIEVPCFLDSKSNVTAITHLPISDSPNNRNRLRSRSITIWHGEMRQHWWDTGLKQLKMFTKSLPEQQEYLIDKNFDEARARFIGEVYHTVSEVRRHLNTAPSDDMLPKEYTRLNDALELFVQEPQIIAPFSDSSVAYMLAKMFVYGLPRGARECEYVMGSSTEHTSLDYVNDQVNDLIQTTERYAGIER